MSLNAEIGALLAALREKAKVTQSHIAGAMGKSQASLLRLEAGDIGATPEDYAAYLTALGTPDARAAQLLIATTWRHLPRPPLQHPDIDDLIAAETALDRLSAFLDSDAVPRAVGGQAEMLIRRIHDFGDFLRSLKHRIAWIGDIGVGKTTAACRQAGLVVDAASAADLRGVILDTGGGRVTLCEVSVITGTSFAIEVEPAVGSAIDSPGQVSEIFRIDIDRGEALFARRFQRAARIGQVERRQRARQISTVGLACVKSLRDSDNL